MRPIRSVSSILVAPANKILMFMIPYPLPGWVFGLIFLGISFFLAKRNRENPTGGDNIGHEAHFWGAIFGFVVTGLVEPHKFVEFFREAFFWL